MDADTRLAVYIFIKDEVLPNIIETSKECNEKEKRFLGVTYRNIVQKSEEFLSEKLLFEDFITFIYENVNADTVSEIKELVK